MVSVLPTSLSANGIFSWLVYGMLFAASYSVADALLGADLESAVTKGA